MKPRRVKPAAPTVRDDLRAFIGIRRMHVKIRECVPGVAHSPPAARTVVIHQGGARWGVNVPRLHEIEEALFRGAPVDEGLREELRAVVAVLAYQQEAQLAKRPGPREDRALFERASVVLMLRRKHGVKLEAALNAVARQDGDDDARRKDRQNIEAKYHKLKATRGTVSVRETDVLAALDRLNIPRNPK